MAVFDIFESILLQVGVTLKGLQTLRKIKIKLNMVYNTLKKIFLGSNIFLPYITMATIMHSL